MSNIRPRTILLLLLITFVNGVIVSQWNKKAEGMDFYQWWLIPQAMHKAIDENIYTVESRLAMYAVGTELAGTQPSRQRAAHLVRRTVDTFSSPFMYACFRPFAALPYESAFLLYHVILTASVVASVLLMGRMFGLGWDAALAALLSVLVACWPLHVDLNVGNVTCLQLAGLTLYTWLRSRPQPWAHGLPAGVLLGLIVLFKPTAAAAVVCLGAYWLARREFRTIAEQAGGFTLGIALGWLYSLTMFPMHAWADWLKSLEKLRVILHVNNLSLYRLIEVLGAPGMAKLLPVAAMLAALLGVWCVRKSREPGTELFVIALGLAATLVGSDLVWVQYFVLAVPLMIFALRPLQGRPGVARPTPLVWLMIAAIAIVLQWPARLIAPHIALGLHITLIDASLVVLAAAGVWSVVKSSEKIGDAKPGVS